MICFLRLTACCGIKAVTGAGETTEDRGGGLIPSIFSSFVAKRKNVGFKDTFFKILFSFYNIMSDVLPNECRKCGKLFYKGKQNPVLVLHLKYTT